MRDNFNYSLNSPDNQNYQRFPINVQPRPMPIKKLPTNEQVFGAQKNSVPTGRINSDIPKPMSGINHNLFNLDNNNHQFNHNDINTSNLVNPQILC